MLNWDICGINILSYFELNVLDCSLVMTGVDSVSVGGDFDMSVSSPLLVGGVECLGSEQRLQDCHVTWWEEGVCPQEVRYARVDCTGEFLVGHGCVN